MAATRTRNWVWVFAGLAVLGVAAVAINWVYNARQQLTLDELHRERALWEKAGPRDYLLELQMTAGSNRQSYVIRVRHGQVESAVYRPAPDAPGQPLRADQYGYYTMPGLFDLIERNLERDAQPGAPRALNRAQFDPGDGHLIYYLRSSTGGREQRVEIRVTRFEPGPPP